MPALTTPDALKRMVSDYVVALLDVPAPVEDLPFLFVKILPDNDYLEPPIVWASCLSKALGLLGKEDCSAEDYVSFRGLLKDVLSSLGRKQKPTSIVDPYYKIIREKWESDNPGWAIREALYQLHFIRPELKHADFGDTVRGIRVSDALEEPKSSTMQDLIDSFYAENPSTKAADQVIKSILEGKSRSGKKRLSESRG